jgi:formate hydrogenlyase transcriptional activator
VNIRLVAATNRDLESMVANREFRSDLFYRLHVFPIRIPPLRERREDIPLLAKHFVQKIARQMQKKIDSVPTSVIKALTAWEWPGNVRELENFIERAVILTRGRTLEAPISELRRMKTDDPVPVATPQGEYQIARIVKDTISTLRQKQAFNEHTKKQREEIVLALSECNGRIGGPDGAAARLGIRRTTLLSRIRRLGINPYEYA